jgi:error-prone DNA polymerase
MEFLTLEDEHGLFEAVLFPQVFRRCRSLIGTLGPYEVAGKVEERYGAVAITAESIRKTNRESGIGNREAVQRVAGRCP